MSSAHYSLKWSKYIPHSPTANQLAFLMLNHREAFYGGAAGGGKVLYDDSVILTPFGFKKGVDLELGDRVSNPDGSISRISHLHQRRKFRVWRVRFHDGTSTDVAEEHLWLAWRSGKRCKKAGVELFGQDSAEVITTRELRDWLITAKRQEATGTRPNWPCIPVASPQRFNVTRKFFSNLDPYLLGLWLGDGHAGGGSGKSLYAGITSTDHSHLRDAIGNLSYSESEKAGTNALTFLFRGKSLRWFVTCLRKLDLFGKHSWDKFIPDEFKLGSLEKREAVLQGLLDTDGFIDQRGQVYFTTVSERLSSDVAFVVQSLGGTATITTKVGSYRSSEGEYVPCRVAYTLYIKLPSSIRPFRLPRKASRWSGDKNLYRRVVSVDELDVFKTGRCITVAHPNGLYLTNDFIVTHNSDALLMAALQHVDVPGYAALILRKTLTDLKQPGALLDRAKTWLSGFPEVKYSASEHTFIFPTVDHEGNPSYPAKIQFGYIGDANAKERYQGIEIVYCAFDELTQHREDDYTYLFSRLRKNKCPIHAAQQRDDQEDPGYVPGCPLCERMKKLPIRMRSASNPGGVGHAWVKQRFKIEPHLPLRDCVAQGIKPRYVGKHRERPFIPSFATDNPYLNLEQYSHMLDELDPVTREQLKGGQWDVSGDARFKRHWARYYSRRGEYLTLGKDGTGPAHHFSTLSIFCVVDPATTSKHGPGDALNWKKMPSYTVISAWAITVDFNLILLDVVRFRREAPEVIKAMKRFNSVWRPAYFLIETTGIGNPIAQTASQQGLTIKGTSPRVDKVANSAEAMLRMERGKVWFPEEASWLGDWEDEIFFWTGHPMETDDQIDVLSNACKEVSIENPTIYDSDLDSGAPDLPNDLYPDFVQVHNFGDRMYGYQMAPEFYHHGY